MTYAELKAQFDDRLEPLYPKEERDSLFYRLLEVITKQQRIEVALSRKQTLPTEKLDPILAALERLANAEPLQYILGQTEFFGLQFYVSEGVLIPRPETEDLVSWIIQDEGQPSTSKKVLDVGTGSGCIAISLAVRCPAMQMHALDISPRALEVARQNAQRNKVEIKFLEDDLFELQSLGESYDVIVSNPPYVRVQDQEHMHQNVMAYEPHSALFVSDEDPLRYYRQLAQLARQSLAEDGALYLEINEYLGAETVALLREHGFSRVELRQDMFGKDRMIKAKFHE
ncbi:peptide chain release factor N(5)-glutamine methyltransferase [Croceiramulus getboli]|nr:peptide chain release factor N(5)-glutamine methyltransferase [Flavobacteriaceae bacterium YJPT1-3]